MKYLSPPVRVLGFVKVYTCPLVCETYLPIYKSFWVRYGVYLLVGICETSQPICKSVGVR